MRNELRREFSSATGAAAHKRRPIALGVLLGVVGLLVSLLPATFALEERLGLGLLFTLRGPLPSPSEVAVVGISGESAACLRDEWVARGIIHSDDGCPRSSPISPDWMMDRGPSGLPGEGRWRGYVNAALQRPYSALFARLSPLVLLAAPSFDVVLRWRTEQERKLRERLQREGGDASRVMDDAQIARFISHYERITRHILSEMPARADHLIALDADRRARWQR